MKKIHGIENRATSGKHASMAGDALAVLAHDEVDIGAGLF